jgi:sulfite reductase alpha subunit-like flavoprotein
MKKNGLKTFITVMLLKLRIIHFGKEKVVGNERITDPLWEQNTRHLVIRVENVNHRVLYQAGDICSIMPCNSKESVDALLQVLQQSIRDAADYVMDIACLSPGAVSWPKHCTLRGWLAYCADIQALPEREDLRELSLYCGDTEQSEKLLSLSETSSSALNADYILRRSDRGEMFSMISTLSTCRWNVSFIYCHHFALVTFPLQVLPQQIQLSCVLRLLEGTTPLGRSYRGVCSSYLASCTTGTELVWLKPGSFRLPLTVLPTTNQYQTPILCIGAGTRIALLYDHFYWNARANDHKALQKNVMPG